MSWQDVDFNVLEEPCRKVGFDLNGTGKALLTFGVVLFGWSIKNVSTTTVANIDIYDGTDTSGNVSFPINLAGNETSREWFGARGVKMGAGVYVNVTAQEVKGSLFYLELPRP